MIASTLAPSPAYQDAPSAGAASISGYTRLPTSSPAVDPSVHSYGLAYNAVDHANNGGTAAVHQDSPFTTDAVSATGYGGFPAIPASSSVCAEATADSRGVYVAVVHLF